MIPALEPITTPVRRPNARLWELYAMNARTPAEEAELCAIEAQLEAEYEGDDA